VLHAWSAVPDPTNGPVLALFNASFHRRWAWSEKRWQFVASALRAAAGAAPRWCEGPWPAHTQGVAEPHAVLGLATPKGWTPVPRIWPEPGHRCPSFSQYWRVVQAAAA
jgi:deoxyribodipyrimidine photo-lyase